MWNKVLHIEPLYTRLDFLMRGGAGFGGLALTYLLGADNLLGAGRTSNPLAARAGHFPAKAKSVIFLFMEGGPSHIDLFDPKPKLNELAGQPMPASFGKPITAMGTASNSLMGTKRTFKQYGQSGMWVSDWYPHVAQHVDEMSI